MPRVETPDIAVAHLGTSVSRTDKLQLPVGFCIGRSRVSKLETACGASPFRLSAVLVRYVRHTLRLVGFISIRLCKHELEFFRGEIGRPSGQAVWEALVLVVAVRAWKDYLEQSSDVVLAVKSDSLAALGAARSI